MFGEGVSGFGHSRGARRSILLSLGPLSGMNAFVRVWVVLCLIIYVSKIHPLSTANVSSSDSAVASSVHMNTFRLLPHSVSAAASFVTSSSVDVSRLGSVLTVAPESGMIAALPCPHGISASSSDSAVASSVHTNTFRLLPHSVSVVASFVASSSMNVSRVRSLPTVAPESKMIAASPCPHGISASSSDSAVTSSVHMYTFSGVTLMPICLTLS